MWCRRLAIWLLATAKASLALSGEVATFWVLRSFPSHQAVQEQVQATKVAAGRKVDVYFTGKTPPQPPGSATSGDWGAILETAQLALDKLGSLAPELIPEKPVAVLLGNFGWGEPVFFSPFDKLGEPEAKAFGFHSNERPVLYAEFPYSGEQAWRNHASLVQQLFLQFLVPQENPFPASSSLPAAKWFAYHAGFVPLRALWGDEDNRQGGPPSWSYQNESGWGPLFVAYLAETLGPRAPVELVLRQDAPTGPYRSLLAALAPTTNEEQLFRAFMNRLWFPGAKDSWLLPFTASPRPSLLAETVASRPYSGQVRMGRGGIGLLALVGDGGRSLPLALQGEASVSWVGCARKANAFGVGDPIPIAFDNGGFAQIEVPPLAPGERFLVFLGVLPEPQGDADERLFNLQWGLAWSPKPRGNRTLQELRELAGKRFGVLAPPLRTRVMASLSMLSGRREGKGAQVVSRYAWHPAAQLVADNLLQEAKERGLPARIQSFLRTTPWGITAEWRNVLLDLPGSGSPRLPLVLAAHWDACTDNLWESYRTARSVKDNALAVVTALEVAAALRRQPHRLPVIVALLAGGCHDAAGAQALLASLAGRVAVWVELEQLWPEGAGDPARLVAYLGDAPTTATPRLAGIFRRWGFALEVRRQTFPPHTGAGLAEHRGALTITLAQPPSASARRPRVSPDAELTEVSPDAVLLLAGALTDLVQDLGGR